MGNKITPNILRLGLTKSWKTEFFEKKKKELPLFIFKDLEIKDYIHRFLDLHGIVLHDYKQHYSNSTLYLYISYFVIANNSFQTKRKNQDFFLINKAGKVKMISLFKKYNNILTFKFEEYNITNKFLLNRKKKLYDIKNFFKSDLKFKNLLLLKGTKSSNFNKMFKVISLFTQNKFNIKINFVCINKDLNFIAFLKTKKIKMIQKFKTASFFKDGLELLFHVAFNRSSAKLLANFISSQLKVLKSFKFFLSFIKQTLLILMSSQLSVLKGVKIILKGRLSKSPRARHKIIIIGDVPVHTLNCRMDYFQVTTQNDNGSCGIKVWIIEK